MSFRPLTGDLLAKRRSVQMAASTTIVAGQALVYSSGLLVPATSAATEVNYVAEESRVSGAGEKPFINVLSVDGVEFEADCTNNTAEAQQGLKHDLTDGLTLANGTTTNKVFFVDMTVGAVANKKVRGHFVVKAV